MVKLIQNELIKIFKRPGTLVMVALVVLMIGVFAAFAKYSDSKVEETNNWKQQVAAETAGYEKELQENPGLNKEYKDYLQEQIKINEYRIKENMPVSQKETMYSFIEGSGDVLSFAGLFMIIIAAGMVASEFTWGTIKLLLIRPISRAKILVAKYTTVILFGLLLVMLSFAVSAGIGAVLFGNVGDSVHLAYENGKVIEQSQIVYLLKSYLLRSVDLLMMATMAFMISTVFRNNSLAIGISLFLMLVGQNITMLLAIKFEWTKYLLFANTYLMQYESGRVPVEGMTMGFSLAVLAVYFIVFHLLSFLSFSKRDVAA